MPPLGFSDEEMNAITTLAAALPHSSGANFSSASPTRFPHIKCAVRGWSTELRPMFSAFCCGVA
jgi:hypothetical protein